MARSHVIISGIIIALSLGVNLDQGALAQFSIDRGYLLATLLLITLAGLLGHKTLFFIVLVVGLAVTANLPPGLLETYNIHAEVVFATLLALVVTPTGLVLLGWEPAVA
jgi:hypothetical protein